MQGDKIQADNQTRYGLIGCGMMGQEHLRNIALLPGVEVATVFEPDPGMQDITRRLAPQARMVTGIDAEGVTIDAGLLVAGGDSLNLRGGPSGAELVWAVFSPAE